MFSGYESPITQIMGEMQMQMENDCMKVVQQCGFDVNKEELTRALNYDRDQYNKGFNDGYIQGIEDLEQALYEKCDWMINEKWNHGVAPISWAKAYEDFKDDIDELAEQLKEGGSNG